MQKEEKMVERISGVVMVPVISPRWWMAARRSRATKSSGRPDALSVVDRAFFTASIEWSAAVAA